MYHFQYLSAQSRVSAVGAAPRENIRIENGVQVVEPATAVLIIQYLANLCPTGQLPTPAAGVVHWEALPREAAEAAEGGCGEGSALDFARAMPAGAVVMVNVTSATRDYVDVYVATTQETVMEIALEGSDYAVLNVRPGVEEEKKTDMTTLAIGAAAGGAAGFALAGIPGALGGAVGGYLLTDWIV